jgi:hypothetical protein
MGFVNEFIPPEDVERWGLAEIDERFVVGGTRSRQWTIDREREIYLRNVARGGGGDPDIRNQTIWTFYWQGTPLTVRLDLLDGRGGPGEPGWSHWKLVWVNGSHGLPEWLEQKTSEFLCDLKSALTAYKSAGVYSAAYSDYRVTLDIDEGCVL